MTDAEHSPVALLTQAINAVHAGDVVDFDDLRADLRADAEEIVAYVAGRPDLIALDPVSAFVEVVDVLEASGEDAGKVALLGVLERFDGAFGSAVLQRAPLVRAQEEATGWSPDGPIRYVEALIDDALVGYPVDREVVEESAELMERLGRKMTEMVVPKRLAAVTRQLPRILSVLLEEGPDAAEERISLLALESRLGMFDD
jgi:hypothetical protein